MGEGKKAFFCFITLAFGYIVVIEDAREQKGEIMRKIALLLLVSISVFAGVSVQRATPLGYRISCDLAEEIIQINDFVKVEIEGSGDFSTTFEGEIGGPSLPVVRKLIRIPEGDGFSISADFERSYVDLQKRGLPGTLYPHQPPRFKSGKPFEFSFDAQSYNGRFGTEIAHIEPVGYIRGKRIGLLTIYPVMYDADGAMLEIRRNIEISINFENPVEPVEQRLSSGVFMGITSHILEPVDIDPNPLPGATYVIITHPDYTDSLMVFKRALASWGYRVRIVTTAETGEDVEDIQDYLQTAYDDWDNPPEFVLFVGSFEQVTATVTEGSGWFDPGHPTDLYYVTTDGDDYLPDMIHGRMAVEDFEDLRFLLTKTLRFYNWDFDDPEIWKKIAFAACGEDGLYEVAMGTHQYAMEEYFHAPDFTPDSVWAIDGESTEEVLEVLNDNVFLFNYSGHCSEDGWSNPTFEISDLTMVMNEHPALLIGNCCLSGKFDEECFAARVTNRHNGAVVYIGASNSTMWDEDDVWERQMYDDIMEGDYHHSGSFMYSGNLAVLEDYEDEAQYYFEIYHNFGDPALVFAFGEPDSIDVDGFAEITSSAEDVSIYPSENDAWVAISSGDSLIDAQLSSAGMADLDLGGAFVYPDTARLVVWKPNFWRPYIADIPTTPGVEITYTPDSIRQGSFQHVEITLHSESVDLSSAFVFATSYGVHDTSYVDDSYTAAFDMVAPYGEIITFTAVNGGDVLGSVDIPVYDGREWAPFITDISVPMIGMEDSLAVDMLGTFTCVSPVAEFSVDMVQAGGFTGRVDVSETSLITELTPLNQNDIEVAFIKGGYNIMFDTVRVVRPMTLLHIMTLSVDGGEYLPGVSFKMWDSDADTSAVPPVVEGISDSLGTFITSDPIPMGIYQVYAGGFGYMPLAVVDTVDFSAELILEIEMGDRSTITGEIHYPLPAWVRLLHPDTKEIMYQTFGDRTYMIEDIVSGDYILVSGCRGYKPYVEDISVYEPDMFHNIGTDMAEPFIAIIDNTGAGGAGDMAEEIFSVIDVIPDVFSDFTLDDLLNYELIIYSTNDNSDPLDTDHLEILLQYNRLGGRIVFEGGELGYAITDMDDDVFARELLHVTGWRSDSPEDVLLPETADTTRPPYFDPLRSRDITDFASAGHWDYYIYDVLTPEDNSMLVWEASARPGSGVMMAFSDEENAGFRRTFTFATDYYTGFWMEGGGIPYLLNAIEYTRYKHYGHAVIGGKIQIEYVPPYTGTEYARHGDIDAVVGERGVFTLHIPAGSADVEFGAEGHADTTISFSMEEDTYADDVYVFLRSLSDVDEQEYMPDAISRPYPNPANASFAVDYNMTGIAEIRLLNTRGRQVLLRREELAGSGTLTFQLDGLETGIYLYSIETENETKTGKFVLMK